MALDAIIFDIDGTLIDSNALHVEAFRAAFANHGYTILPDRIAVEIGKGGDNLVPDILGTLADKKDGDAIRKDQPKEFEKLAAKQGLKPFPMVLELIAESKRRGLLTIIATSGAKEQVRLLQKYSKLELEHAVDLLITADDAGSSKPAPDLITAVLEKSKMSAAQCVMIGDTVYDATSARRAGVISLGLRCGGNTDTALLDAGMRKVFEDPADLLKQFDDALHIASPGELHLTIGTIERLMEAALTAAEEGFANGEAPIGAVLARGDGTIIARGWNQQNKTQNKIAHAEIVAFNAAAGKVPVDAKDLIMVSTLEPCVMCVSAAMEASVDTILFGLRAPADAGSDRVVPPRSPDSQMPRIIGDILDDRSLKLFKQWYAKNSASPQAKYVRQLLEHHQVAK